MKTSDLFLLIGGAVGIFIIAQFIKKQPARQNSIARGEPTPSWTSKIMDDNGWQYFTDGTVIGPDGKYYKNETLVYDPAGMYGATA